MFPKDLVNMMKKFKLPKGWKHVLWEKHCNGEIVYNHNYSGNPTPPALITIMRSPEGKEFLLEIKEYKR